MFGFAHTHVILSFTRRDQYGREETACGQFIGATQIAPAETTPSCWGCAAWIEALGQHDPARVLAQITPETPWGAPTREDRHA